MEDTDCRNCGASMPPMKRENFGNLGALFPTFKVTAYRCESCGHWNNLKRRKPKAINDEAASPAQLGSQAMNLSDAVAQGGGLNGGNSDA